MKQEIILQDPETDNHNLLIVNGSNPDLVLLQIFFVDDHEEHMEIVVSKEELKLALRKLTLK